MLPAVRVLGTNKDNERGKKWIFDEAMKIVELLNFFTNHHQIRYLCIFFRVLYVYESSTHRTISSKNNLNQNNDTQWHNNPIHSNNIFVSITYPTTMYYPTAYRAMYPTTCSLYQHTEPCIQQHIERHTEQRIIPTSPNNIHTTYHTSSVRQTKQQSTSGPIRRRTKRPFKPIKRYGKPNSLHSIQQSTSGSYTVSLESLLFSCIFLFFCARSVWMYDPSEFLVYRGIV